MRNSVNRVITRIFILIAVFLIILSCAKRELTLRETGFRKENITIFHQGMTPKEITAIVGVPDRTRVWGMSHNLMTYYYENGLHYPYNSTNEFTFRLPQRRLIEWEINFTYPVRYR